MMEEMETRAIIRQLGSSALLLARHSKVQHPVTTEHGPSGEGPAAKNDDVRHNAMLSVASVVCTHHFALRPARAAVDWDGLKGVTHGNVDE